MAPLIRSTTELLTAFHSSGNKSGSVNSFRPLPPTPASLRNHSMTVLENDTFDDYIYFGQGNHDFKEGLNDPAGSSNRNSTQGPTIIVRGEEIGITVVILLLWVGAIILFFNRWGKIRMLEPYQPKFCENHRLSCPMADATTCPRSHSKFNLSAEGSSHFAKCNYHGVTSGIGGLGLGASGLVTEIRASSSRPRQNSVFVTSPHSSISINSSIFKNISRKTKSALDLSTLVLSEEFFENVRRNSKNSITHL